MPNLLRSDPSRTRFLRARFERDLNRRLSKFSRELRDIVVGKDVFGLKGRQTDLRRVLGINVESEASEFWAVLIGLPSVDLSRIQEELDPQDILKLETYPHVTARFGFTEDPTVWADHVYEPPTIKFNGFGVFRNPESDVLYVRVISQDLIRMNHQLGAVPNVRTHGIYVPHMTVAFLKSGTGIKYPDSILEESFRGTYEGRISLVVSSPKRTKSIVGNVESREWAFLSDDRKLEEFEKWLQEETGMTIVPEGERYWEQYVEEGYRKGAGRAWQDSNRKRIESAIGDEARLGAFSGGRRTEFINLMLGAPESVQKVKLLASRVFTDLKGVTGAMATQMRRTLADGLVQGQNARTIARELSNNLDISRRRATVIARTEIIRAHAEGQLDALERMGVTEVGVAVEWSTAGDDRVCPLCIELEGVVLKVKEAHNLIPRHPQCRCAFVPANVGESTRGQVRSKSAIQESIRSSLRKEGGKKRSLEEARKASTWPGKHEEVDKKRPKSIV